MAGIKESQSERPESGTNLEYNVVLGKLSTGNDTADRVGIMDEVLAERFCRTEGQFRGKFANSAGAKIAISRTNGCRTPTARRRSGYTATSRGPVALRVWRQQDYRCHRRWPRSQGRTDTSRNTYDW